MRNLAATKLSSKGQVVIPEEIRNQMHLQVGDQFLVIAEKGVIIFKIIEKPDTNEYRDLILKTRKLAASLKLTKKDLSQAIKMARQK